MDKEKLLWVLFGLQIVLTGCGVAGMFPGHVFNMIVTYVPVALLVVHACLTLTPARGVLFIALAGFIGWLAEVISLHVGTLFGGEYSYPAQVSLASVPVAVIAYWAVFIYIGYWLVSSFALWLGKNKPRIAQHNLGTLCVLVLCDGVAVTAIDLFMDPISVKTGAWSWTYGGPYFGVPIGNFVGWFMVTIVATGLFRLFEYYKPHEDRTLAKTTFLLPVLGYLLIGVNFLLAALSHRMIALAAIGSLLVIAPAIANLLLFLRYKKSA